MRSVKAERPRTKIGPRSCYDEGKRCAETPFFDYHRQSGLEIKVARIFNTYGPRMHHYPRFWVMCVDLLQVLAIH
jgi:nucleoside-diphosphate-sugar epimerase